MNVLHIGENILKYRHGKRITQEEVARYLGVTKASVSKWENAQSMPDITLLPQLAAFFGVSVDELMGYESQLTDNQINQIYEELCKGFAKGEIKETFVLANAYIRNHYSCHEFLNRMCTLFINHYFLLETREEQNMVLDQVKKMSRTVLSESTVQKERRLAIVQKCYADMALEHPEYVVDTLEPLTDPLDGAAGESALLIQAYQAMGKVNKAIEFTQVCLYKTIMNQVTYALSYLTLNMDNPRVAKDTISNTLKLIDLYKVIDLNPNLTAQFYFLAANFYAAANNATETLKMLELYATSIDELFGGPLSIRGNEYFNAIDGWIDAAGAHKVPRDVHLIAKNAVETLDHPPFAFIQATPEMKSIRAKVERAAATLTK